MYSVVKTTQDESIIIWLPHTADLPAPSEGCTPPSHSYLIISILKMHVTCNNNAGFIAYPNNTDVYWDPLGPELQRHQLFKMLYAIPYHMPEEQRH